MAGPSVALEAPTVDVDAPPAGRRPGRVPVTSEADVRTAVAAARSVQPEWGRLSPRKRSARMLELARVVERRADELVACLVDETGKPRAEALASVVVCVDLIRFYARVAPRHLRRRRVGTGWILWKRAYAQREPFGVIGAITPWNYPLILSMDAVVSGLFGGNAVVLKPSEFTSFTALMIADLCREAGLPDHLVRVVTGDASTGAALVRSGVDKVSFTGSTGAGRQVMAAAAESLTPVLLELGGNDPALILEDADLDRAARGVAFGAFFNAGQTCISIERVYVARAVADAFIERLVAVTRSLRAGIQEERDVGPMITEAQYVKVVEQIEDALAKGARALTGGVPDGGTRVIQPTVLVDVDDSMRVMSEETFGPVVPIVLVDSEDEAVTRANASNYGLCASVWAGDRARGLRVAARLQSGVVSLNDCLSHYSIAGLPMGGNGDSGFGRRRGLEGLDEMTRVRSLFVDIGGLRREPWWFPYDQASERLTRAVLAWRARGGASGLVSAARRLLAR